MRPASSSDQLDMVWFCQLAADGEFIGTVPERRPMLPYITSLVETAEHEAWTASIATLARTQGDVVLPGAALAAGVAPVP